MVLSTTLSRARSEASCLRNKGKFYQLPDTVLHSDASGVDHTNFPVSVAFLRSGRTCLSFGEVFVKALKVQRHPPQWSHQKPESRSNCLSVSIQCIPYLIGTYPTVAPYTVGPLYVLYCTCILPSHAPSPASKVKSAWR